MKLSTRSRYGIRMMLELSRQYEKGPVQINEISSREEISAKYLEQLIIPLKKAGYIKSIRGPKGGHLLTKSPVDISIGEIIRLLEKDANLSKCIEHPENCDRNETCVTRDIWRIGTEAMFDKFDSIKLSDLITKENQKRQTD